MNVIDWIKEKMEDLNFPKIPRADWENTNHYELSNFSSGTGEFTWLDIPSIFMEINTWDDTEQGKRLGFLLDLAEKLPEILTYISELEKDIEVLNEREQGDS